MVLNDKVILITGAGQGLGRAMALAFAEKGAKLALIDLQQENLSASVALCQQIGADTKGYIANVADETEVVAAFEKIIGDFRAIDGLINNAGITRDALLVKKDQQGQVQKSMSLSQWQAVIDVNLTGVFLCGREAAAKMLELGTQGLILNISSICKAGNIGQSNYAAAKAGVAALTATWSKELARHGIRVAGIAPGFISTEMTANIKPEALEKLVKMIPIGRMGTAQEIAHSAIYLFENDYFNGRILELDGGMRL